MAYYKNDQKTGLRYPAINDMIEKADNKYELVLATAKRAREIVAGAPPLVKIGVNNPVSIATKEINEDAVKVISELPNMPETEEVFPEEMPVDGVTTEEIVQGMILDV